MTEHKENKTRNPKHHSVLSITLQWMAGDHPETETNFKYISLCIIFYLQLWDAPTLILVWLFWRGWGGESLEFRSSVLVSRSRGNACHLPREEGIFVVLFSYIYIYFQSEKYRKHVSLLQLSRFCIWNGKWVPPVWHWNESLYQMLSQNHPDLTASVLLPALSDTRGSPTLLPIGKATVGSKSGTQCWFFFAITLHLLQHLGNLWKGREGPSWAPCLRAKPLFPLEQAAAAALPAARLRQALAALVCFGFPLKKEAASPTSGLVRSSESWFMMQIMVWRWSFFFPSAEYLGSIFS